MQVNSLRRSVPASRVTRLFPRPPLLQKIPSGTPAWTRRDVRAVTDSKTISISDSDSALKDLEQTKLTEDKKDQFDWFKQWYAIAVDDYLDDTRPYAFELLGMPLVLWRDGSGKWRCFENACPHRAAPLSEGRVEKDGNLLCSYHAWRFNGEGKCVALPQAKDEATFKEIVKQPRACAKTFPVTVLQGIVWVWADCSPTAHIDCQVRQPAIVPEMESDLPDTFIRTEKNYMFRDLPYGWDYTHENVMDRAHLAISHHGITGSRYADAYFMDTDVSVGPTLQDGFRSKLKTLKEGVTAVNASFEPPCLWKAVTTFPDGTQDFVLLYSSPKKPGFTRWVGVHWMNCVKNTKCLPSGFARTSIPINDWIKHLVITRFIHQDVAFLHFQERYIARFRGDKSLHEKYWMPTPQDKDVIVFRKWLQRAGGYIPYVGYPKGYVPPLVKEEEMFDFWNNHVKHCRKCQQGYKDVKRMRAAVWAFAAFCFVKAMITAAIQKTQSWIPPKGSIILSAVGLVCLGLIQVLNIIVDQFHLYRYNHQDND